MPTKRLSEDEWDEVVAVARTMGELAPLLRSLGHENESDEAERLARRVEELDQRIDREEFAEGES